MRVSSPVFNSVHLSVRLINSIVNGVNHVLQYHAMLTGLLLCSVQISVTCKSCFGRYIESSTVIGC